MLLLSVVFGFLTFIITTWLFYQLGTDQQAEYQYVLRNENFENDHFLTLIRPIYSRNICVITEISIIVMVLLFGYLGGNSFFIIFFVCQGFAYLIYQLIVVPVKKLNDVILG